MLEIFHPTKPVFLPTIQWPQTSQQQAAMECKPLLQPQYLLHNQGLELLPRPLPSLPRLLHPMEIPPRRDQVSAP